MKIFLLLILLLLCMPIILGERIVNGSNTLIIGITGGAGSINNGSNELFITVQDFAGTTTNGTNTLCIGLLCQMFSFEKEIEELIEEEEEVVSGGGGEIIPEQKIEITTMEEFNTSLNICVEQMGGIPVNIKGSIFCKITGEINDTYIPIEMLLKPKKISFLGFKIPNIGAFISKENPIIGWTVISLVFIALILFIIEQRDIVEWGEIRRKARARVKKRKEEKEGKNPKNI